MISVTAEGKIDADFTNHKCLLRYPCSDENCYPYKVELSKGKYLIECWGASGSNEVSEFVRGAYVSGILYVETSLTLYAYLGNVGVLNGTETFNGGGHGSKQGNSGGGATDFRLVNGSFSSLDSLLSRIIVAGGGAGLNQYRDQMKVEPFQTPYYEEKYDYGNGGTDIGGNGYLMRLKDEPQVMNAAGGSQKEGGLSGYCTDGCGGHYPTYLDLRAKLGIGCNAQWVTYTSGGGGGYFGGGSGAVTAYTVGSGAGGSSYVSGHPKCSSLKPNNSNDNGYDVDEESSIHYSNIAFLKPIMIGGNENIVEPNGTLARGHSGPGYARITILSRNGIHTCKCSNKFIFIILFVSIIIMLK